MKKLHAKRILPLLTCCAIPGTAAVIVAPLTTMAAQAQVSASPISVLHNGRLMKFDVPPVEMNGRVLVPLRGVFEALGATVDFDAATNNIFAVRNGTQIQLRVGSADASLNGVPRQLDVPAQTYGGRTLVPLRFVSEALGANVNWNAGQRAVYITVDGTSNPVPTPTPIPNDPVFPPGTGSEATTTVTGTVASVRPNGRVFEISTEAGEQMTIRLDAAPTPPLQEGDRVQVSGTMRGNALNALNVDLVVLEDEKTTVNGRIISFQGNNRLMVQARNETYAVQTNGPVPDDLVVGDFVRVNGRVNGTNVTEARVSKSRRPGRPGGGRGGNNNNNGDGPRDNDGGNASQPVSFSGSVERINAADGTLQVRGDNGQTYTINFNGARNFKRGDRVNVVGNYRNGVTTATTITQID